VSEAVVAPRPRWLLRALGWIIAAAVVFFVVRRIDFAALGAALESADWRFVALAVACNVAVNAPARVLRWQALLEPIEHRQRATFLDLLRISLASGAISNLLPARAGEAVRVIELKRRRGYPASALIAAQLAEKGIEAVSLGLVLGSCALLPGPVSAPLAVAGALAAAAVGEEVEYVVGLPGEGVETEVFFSDLSHEYVRINAEYTT
jgi:uncharacterized protein (TIRG00374 family)